MCNDLSSSAQREQLVHGTHEAEMVLPCHHPSNTATPESIRLTPFPSGTRNLLFPRQERQGLKHRRNPLNIECPHSVRIQKKIESRINSYFTPKET